MIDSNPSKKTVNARIRDALRAAGVHCSVAELADMIDEDAAGIATRLSQLYRAGELERRLGDGGRFEYGIVGADAARPAPKVKPRRGPPRPITAARPVRSQPQAAAAKPPPKPAAPPAPQAPSSGTPARAPAAAPVPAQGATRTLPDVVRDFITSGEQQTLQQRGAVVLGHMHQLAEHAASEAPPSAVVQILRAARKLRAALEAS